MSENETNKSYEHIEEILKNDKRLKTETGELRTNLLHELVNNYDTKLFELLLSDEKIKNTFFIPVKDTFVFKHRAFKDFIDYNTSNNSYSKYLGKQIGLYVDDVPLADRGEVVLNFPFKDCVLEGGQRTEDGTDTYFEYDEKTKDFEKKQSKRREIFYNEILARDEIDQLFAPKAFCNAKKYDKDGEQQFTKFDRNADGTITDNLIIKGNNLLALHSLYQQFAGKVKLIYIDPPYNTGNDSFAYNNSFNHSTWLTFMKNRLEIARELLREDGVIMVQCDDNEQAYLKVLMDDVFGRDNFISTAPRKTGAGNAAIRCDYELRKPFDFILFYSKDKTNLILNKLIVGEKGYNFEDKNGKYRLGSFQASGSDATRTARPNLYYPIYVNSKGEMSLEKTDDYIKEILPKKINGSDGRWMWKQEKFITDSKTELICNGKNIQRKIYFDKNKDQNIYQVEKAYFDESSFRNSVGTIELKELLGSSMFNNPKPESLIEKLFQISTNKSDIVLDFNLGSGTTAAVAHKMKRQYIGIEQMDYIETVAVERLKKVIEGEQGGISKSINWQGGGEFIYLELKKYNQAFIEQIEEAKDTDALLQIWEHMKYKSFLNYNVDIKKQDEHLEEFKALSFAEQKQHLCEILDKNQLYVNRSSLNDTDFACTEEEKKVTKDFYQIRK